MDTTKQTIQLAELDEVSEAAEEEEKDCIVIDAKELELEEEAGEVPGGSGLMVVTGKTSNEDGWTSELVGAGNEQEDDGDEDFVDAEEHPGEGDKAKDVRVEGAETKALA